MMVSYNMKAQYKVELHTDWNHKPEESAQWSWRTGASKRYPQEKKMEVRCLSVWLSDCLPLPIMFYILFIVRNLCNLILSIEGHSFDLLQPQAVAVVRNLHLHHQPEANLVWNGWMERMLWWFWSIYSYFRWGRVKSKLKEVKRSILRSRSLSKMFQFKLFRYNIRAEWPTEVEIQFQLDWGDWTELITVYELQLCLQK